MVVSLNTSIPNIVYTGIYCYFGTKITTKFLEYGEVAYFTKWYNYPVKYQKYFILLISEGQKDVSFSGFGLINCSVGSFLMVSYWMPFLFDQCNNHIKYR